MANRNPSPSTRFSKDNQPANRRRPDPLLAAVKGKMTDQRAAVIMEQVIAQAEAGNLQAVSLLWDRLAGKPVARNEDGKPGDFDESLDDVETDVLRAALKRVK